MWSTYFGLSYSSNLTNFAAGSCLSCYAVQFDFVFYFFADSLFTLLVGAKPICAMAKLIRGRCKLFRLWMLELSDAGSDRFYFVVQLVERNCY